MIALVPQELQVQFVGDIVKVWMSRSSSIQPCLVSDRITRKVSSLVGFKFFIMTFSVSVSSVLVCAAYS